MNKSLVIGLVAGAVVAAGAGAAAGLKLLNHGPEYAEVLKVTPLTRTVHTPRQDCHDENVTHQGPVKDQHQILSLIHI